MKRTALACILAFGGLAVYADAPPKNLSYANFNLVRTRNIFDPERQPYSAHLPPVAAHPSAPPIPDYVAVTGTLVTEEKALAFFGGSRPEFNAVLGVSGTVANMKVTRITPEHVEVNRAGKPFVIPVGQQLALDGTAPIAAAPKTEAPSAPPAPPSAGAPGQADIIRRMMERRQKEIR